MGGYAELVTPSARRSHECERGTHECVRHKGIECGETSRRRTEVRRCTLKRAPQMLVGVASLDPVTTKVSEARERRDESRRCRQECLRHGAAVGCGPGGPPHETKSKT